MKPLNKGSERVEIKNVTGFKAVESALLAEEKRQKELIEAKEKVERAYQECLPEMPFYWNAETMPWRHLAYTLHEK